LGVFSVSRRVRSASTSFANEVDRAAGAGMPVRLGVTGSSFMRIHLNLGGAVRYEAPRVRVFGSFRELTQIGQTGSNDQHAVLGANAGGCGDPNHLDCRS